MILPGFDGKEGTADDITVGYSDKFFRSTVEYSDKAKINEAAGRINEWARANDFQVPSEEEAAVLIGEANDSFGRPIVYQIVSSRRCRVFTLGGDGKPTTGDDAGLNIRFSVPEKKKEGLFDWMRPDSTWLTRRMKKLGVDDQEIADDSNHFVGGQSKFEGARYFWFFTWLILGTALLFVVVAYFYKPREYFHDDDETDEVSDEEAVAEMH